MIISNAFGPTKSRLVLLALLLVVITSTTTIVEIMILYRHHFEEERAELMTTVQSQARLIEAMAEHNAEHAIKYPENYQGNSQQVTLEQLRSAHDKYPGFGRTGEFTLAEHVGSEMVFQFRHRLSKVDVPPSIPFESELAEPMRRALQGLSGTVIGLDYRGVMVLAAHEPVAVLNMGVVAKRDLSEVKAPFIRASKITAGMTLLLISIGLILFFRMSSPLVKQMEKSHLSLEKEIEIRKQAERELESHRDHLEELVRSRTSELESRVDETETLNRGMLNLMEDMQVVNTELERTTDQLRESNQELESFSYSVSHDLRAPLRAIDGFSRILVEDYADQMDDEGRRVLDVVTSNAKKMGVLIDDILSLSRMGRRAMNVQPIDTGSLVKEIRDEIMLGMNGRQIHWTIADMPSIHADQTLISQVFTNLMRNAVKFTSSRERTEIELGTTIEDNEIVIYVRDNGVGFDMQYVEKVFEVFQRLHSDDDFKGTGVGLAIVKRIMQRHGGRVWADSEINKGTTMYIGIPKERYHENK